MGVHGKGYTRKQSIEAVSVFLLWECSYFSHRIDGQQDQEMNKIKFQKHPRRLHEKVENPTQQYWN